MEELLVHDLFSQANIEIVWDCGTLIYFARMLEHGYVMYGQTNWI
jgi:hypothetical protein